MKDKLTHWYGVLIASPVGLITWLLTISVFDLATMISALVTGGTVFLSYFSTQQFTLQKYLNEHELTRSEYKYIKKELKSAREKQKRLFNSYKKIRNFSDIKLIFDINRVVRAIMKKVHNEPKLFYNGLQFFHSNLDSAVNMVEIYLDLYRLPGKTKEEKIELNTARLRLLDLKRNLELDLSEINRNDYNQLKIERAVLDRTEGVSTLQLENNDSKVRIKDFNAELSKTQKAGEYIDKK